MLPFSPHPLLRGPHRMTLIPRWLHRPNLLQNVPVEERLFQVEPHSHISAKCHWHPSAKNHATLLIIHGLEGCTDSHYMLGITQKAWQAGVNVVRLNQRNCGGTEHLTPTLYNAGMSRDLQAVITELTNRDGLSHMWLAGFSMGGNLVLKLAGEASNALTNVQGIVGVCPNIHPAACVAALQQPRNFMYHQYFLPRLKARLRRKVQYFPNRWDLTQLSRVRTMSQFDDVYTAPDDGYKDAADYYEQCGSRHVLHHIGIPTLIFTSQDDPFIPYHTFQIEAISKNPHIQLIAPESGGHCGFYQESQPHEDNFWVENRIVEFVKSGQSPTTAGSYNNHHS